MSWRLLSNTCFRGPNNRSVCSLIVEEVTHVYQGVTEVVDRICSEAAGRVVVWGALLQDDMVTSLCLAGATAVLRQAGRTAGDTHISMG